MLVNTACNAFSGVSLSPSLPRGEVSGEESVSLQVTKHGEMESGFCCYNKYTDTTDTISFLYLHILD